MKLLDGKYWSDVIKEEIKQAVLKLAATGKRAPHLAAVLVGENPASEAYVGNKIKSCEQVGFKSTLIRKPVEITTEALLEIINDLNNDSEIDGFIVQLPLPKHIDENKITLAIHPNKDVDGFHPTNFGKMALGMPSYLPATPLGVLELLKRNNIETAGKTCVVVGRSNIVGTPMSILLSRKGWDCTVTLAHSRTKNLEKLCKSADIIVAAIGIAHFIKEDMVKRGAVVIDVGMNRIPDSTKKSGSRLVGDVDFENVAPKCSFITPVPGGVGQLTVAALLLNTLKAVELGNKE